MLQSSGRPFVCRHCLARNYRNLSSANPVTARSWASDINGTWASQRQLVSTQTGSYGLPPKAQSRFRDAIAKPQSAEPRPQKSRIRQQLRQWEEHNHQTRVVLPGDLSLFGGVSNSWSRSQSTDSVELDNLINSQEPTTETSQDEFGGEDAGVTVGVSTRSPGDLVELRQPGSRNPILAIYLGYFGTRNHFYASNGKWITSMGFTPHFTVANFAKPEELLPVLAKIPTNATAPEVFDQMRKDKLGPAKTDGTRLVGKMTDFRMNTERVYQDNLSRFDRARDILSDQRDTRHMSLFDISGLLLPSHLKEPDGFPPYALYAIHTVLYRDELTYHPLSPSAEGHRRDHLFEIAPKNQTTIINRVTTIVREYATLGARNLRPPSMQDMAKTPLGRFVRTARQRVLESRRTRSWTPYGILDCPSAVSLPQWKWSEEERDIISFLEWWASHSIFEAKSRYHATGAIILRALDMYDDAPLGQSTAWTFLQEINEVPPTEVPSRYKVRFPETSIIKGGGLSRKLPTSIQTSKRPDVASKFRKDWGSMPVFCIDAPTTRIIDDGISLERTDKSDEFWIHIHAADPASQIQPNSELCNYMELIPENIYLPGHFQAMLPSDMGDDSSGDYQSASLIKEFSLRPKGPSLAFSAKVNERGDVLEYRVEPGIINNVKYLDPDDVSAFCNEPSPPLTNHASVSVGSPPQTTYVPERPMTAAQDLDQPYKQDLLKLHQLADAIKHKRLSKGAWPYFFPRPSVTVAINNPPESLQSDNSVALSENPYVHVSYGSSMGCSVVSNLMVLAGEIAARWCSSRDIPIPYRRDTKQGMNYTAALTLAKESIYPQIKQGVAPTISQRQDLMGLVGGIEISTSPGPYFILGLDMYAKATSPLRRFSDLLVHWQIHAALAHERETNTTLSGQTDAPEQILPYTSSSMADMLPLLQVREKMARTLSRGSYEWILYALVRAWKYEKTAPRSFIFTVDYRWSNSLNGRINFFDLHVMMDIDGLDSKALVADVKVGDQFEVELVHVNVHSHEILVKALRYLTAPAYANETNLSTAGQ